MGEHHEDQQRPVEEGQPRRAGSEDLQFLELEISQVLQGQASQLARVAFRQALIERIKARLEGRLGDLLDGLAELAADDLIDDLEANLAIERKIKRRAERRLEQSRRLRELCKIGEVDEVEDA